MTTGIKNWSTTAGDNDSTSPNGAPEGMAPSQVNDVIRQVMAEVRSWYENSSWIDFGHAGLTYVDSGTFRLTGDQTGTYQVGRRVRAIGTTPFTIYGTITASAYDSTNTDVDVTWDSGGLDNTLSEVAVGPEVTNDPISSAGVHYRDGDIPVEALAISPVATGTIAPFALSTAPTGWVFAHGGTIGNASSGADRANADTEALFEALWDDYSNDILPILDSAGSASTRGASAAADYAANKRLPVPDISGRSIIGRDNGGGSAANVSQVSTTISTTDSSDSASVASATGLFIGMYVFSTNVPADTTITAIDGTTITLSAVATGTASGTAARFSPINDPQTLGGTGGELSHTTVEDEMPSHVHVQNLIIRPKDGSSNTALPSAGTTPDTTEDTLSAGGDLPHNNMQPSFVANWIIKL